MNISNLSLQARFTLVTILLGGVLLAGTIWSHNRQVATEKHIEINQTKRNWLNQRHTEIRSNLFESYKALDAYLLDPSRTLYRDWVFTALDQAIQGSQLILDADWIQHSDQVDTVKTLKSELLSLKEEMARLVSTREDSQLLFPSLAVSSQFLAPNREKFDNTILLVFYEIEESQTILSNPELYKTLSQLRYNWSQMISNYRIYLANKIGSFRTDVLSRQEQAIETSYTQLEAIFSSLDKMDAENALDFQVSVSLSELKVAAKAWYEGYLKTKEIHNSKSWRADTDIRKNEIEPRLDNVSYLLSLLEEFVKTEQVKDYGILNNVMSNQTTLLWGISIAGLSLLLLILLSLRKLVLKPVATVTSALKDEAFGGGKLSLPDFSGKEVQDLVDAFTEMRKQIHIRQDDLEFQAKHDSLTGLPNRSMLYEEMNKCIADGDSYQLSFTVLLIDLDHFKEINDTLGHHIGDQLLIKVGNRLWSAVRENDMVSRLGGDEYAILLPNTDKEQAMVVIDKICSVIDSTFYIESLNTFIGMSMGVALYPEHGKDPSELMQHADVAMYNAKRSKKEFVFYKASQDEYSIGRLSLSHDLKNAVENHELELHFQPKMDLRTSTISSVEVLLRWNHPQHGYIFPDQFIPLAEQLGVINKISYWVIEEAIHEICAWKNNGLLLSISINLSVHNLHDATFYPTVKELLSNNPDVVDSVIFEITESAMMSNPEFVINLLKKVDTLGIELSIDDYGTGYSSLSYLTQLPVDEVKIDKSFVMNMLDDESQAVIVKSTIEMAHNLGLRVVAEGVENEDVKQMLEDFNCDIIQGYYLTRPLPVNEFLDWLNVTLLTKKNIN